MLFVLSLIIGTLITVVVIFGMAVKSTPNHTIPTEPHSSVDQNKAECVDERTG